MSFIACNSSNRLEKSDISFHNPDPYVKAGQQYIDQLITEPSLRERVVFDTMMVHTSHMVLFNVLNDSTNSKRNMLIVHVNKDYSIDQTFSNIDANKIQKHILRPSKYPLAVSKFGAKLIARQNGFNDGLDPWRYSLVCYAGERDNIQWTIQNTEKKSKNGNRPIAGKSINIRIDTEEVNISSWITMD